MIYSLKGKLLTKKENFFVVDIGALTFKIKTSLNVLRSLPQTGEEVSVFTYLHVREDALELYGFLDQEELRFFEMLIGISGIGPKSALGILGVEKVENLKSAIVEGKSELLTSASGVGKKTADRIILELQSKISHDQSSKIVGIMESDQDIVEALSNLGYTKSQIKDTLTKVDSKVNKLEDRIKETLKLLRNK